MIRAERRRDRYQRGTLQRQSVWTEKWVQTRPWIGWRGGQTKIFIHRGLFQPKISVTLSGICVENVRKKRILRKRHIKTYNSTSSKCHVTPASGILWQITRWDVP